MSTIVTRAGKGSALTWAEADANFTNLNTDKAELNSPTFTGNPTAPTAAVNTNTTQVATTAFVNAEIANDAVAKSGDTMTGTLRTPTSQIGTSATTTENHFWDGSVANQLSLKRGTPEAPGSAVLTVNNGESKFRSLMGYAIEGGKVVQATDKTQPVTNNRPSGRIQTAASSLAANQTVRFTLNSTGITDRDMLVVNRADGGTGSSYRVWCDFVASGSAGICIQNISGAPLAEVININYAVILGGWDGS